MMEIRFLRSESPPEGQAKYQNNIPPTSGSQWQRIGTEVNASFRWLKADFSIGPNHEGTDFRHRFVSGWVISE